MITIRNEQLEGMEKARKEQLLRGEAAPAAVVQPCPVIGLPPAAEWIDIELVGEDDVGIPWAMYEVVLPSGEIAVGQLDAYGCARFDGLSASGNCTIRFPEIDQDAISFVESRTDRPAIH